MNQEQFLKSLNKELLWKTTRAERAQIISDYKEYFEIGKSEGKSETSLISELGNPMFVASEILAEHLHVSVFALAKDAWGSGVNRIKPILLVVNILLLIAFAGYVYFVSNPQRLIDLYQGGYERIGQNFYDVGLILALISLLCSVLLMYCYIITMKTALILALDLGIFSEFVGILGALKTMSSNEHFYNSITRMTIFSICISVGIAFIISYFAFLLRKRNQSV